MWAVYTFISYLVLALLVPVVWASWPTWRKARISRRVTCPAAGAPAVIALDPWYAVRMHALGNSELQVRQCARWPEHRDCGKQCLAQVGATA
jgi:hypothetical protein